MTTKEGSSAQPRALEFCRIPRTLDLGGLDDRCDEEDDSVSSRDPLSVCAGHWKATASPSGDEV
jgi:hypothetical protein